MRRTPERLQGELLQGALALMRERPPWEAQPPLAALRAAAFPKLVISGAHSPVFEAVCHTLAGAIGARHARIPGRAHSVPAVGGAYNDCLESFLARAERER